MTNKYELLFLLTQSELYGKSDKFEDMKSFETYVEKILPGEVKKLIVKIDKIKPEYISTYIDKLLLRIKQINSQWPVPVPEEDEDEEDGRKSRRNLDKSIGKKVSNKRRLSVRRGSRRGVISRRRR